AGAGSRAGCCRAPAFRVPRLAPGRGMRAYKFLRAGGLAPFTGARWPQPHGVEPGAWLEADEVEQDRRGLHACTVEDLPYWFQEELWEVELAGAMHREGQTIVAERGRLLGRVHAWNGESAYAFAHECAARTVELAEREPTVSGHAFDAEANAAKGNA